jgi:hypothetical protein
MKRPKIPAGTARIALPVATVAAAVVSAVTVGLEIALLVVASGALVGVIALLWASVQSLTGESPITLEEALGLGAPSAEEEQKRAVLRALKDLEFERGVGKITEEDYAELSAKYRAEARRLILAVDEAHAKERAEVERLLASRLAEEEKASRAGAADESGEKAPPSGPVSAPEADPPRGSADADKESA